MGAVNGIVFLVAIPNNGEAVKIPATFAAVFTRRSAPSDGTDGGASSQAASSINASSIVDQVLRNSDESSLERTIRLMCDPASSRKR